MVPAVVAVCAVIVCALVGLAMFLRWYPEQDEEDFWF